MVNDFTRINNLLRKIKQELLLYPSKQSITNVFLYENKEFMLDKNNIKKIENLIVQDAVNYSKESLLKKCYRVNKLKEKIKNILEIIFSQNKLKKSPVIKTFYNIITENNHSNIAYILNDNISYAILEQVKRHLKDEDHLHISLISFAELAIILGSTFMEWWYNNFFTKYCEESNIRFYSKDVEFWLKVRKKLINLEKSSPKLKEIQLRMATKIGSYFLEYFIQEKIFEELPLINKVRHLTLSNIYEDDIKMPLSFYKPLLHPDIFSDKIQIKFYQYRFNFIQKENIQSKYTYNKKAELDKCLNTSDTKYCILKPFFDLYLNYLSQIKTMLFTDVIYYPSSENAQIICNFIYHTYQLDIANIILSCPDDQKLVIELLNYMQSDHIFNASMVKLFVNNFKKYRKFFIENNDKIIGKEKATDFIYSTNKYLSDYLDNQINEQNKNDSRVTTAKFLWDAYDKIIYNKFYISSFIKDAYFYSHFQHFYLKKELKGITRIMENAYFLNYQNHRFGRAFLGYYVNNKTLKEQDFNMAKDIFSEVLITTKNKFKDLTYSEYESKTQKAQNEFLTHFFKDTITIENLLETKFTSLLEVITKYTKYFKKANEGLYGLSILHYMLNKEKEQYAHIEPIIVLDSTNSVTQHIANIFNNKLAAFFGCLTGVGYNDLNSYFSKNLNYFIKIKLKEESDKLLKIFKIDNWETITLKTLYNHFNNFLAIPSENNFNFSSFFNNLDIHFDQVKKDLIFPELSQDFRDAFFAIMNGSTLNLDKQPSTFKQELIWRISIVLINYSINQILIKSPWLNTLLKSRDIYKPRIMPEVYGMTSRGGYKAVLKALSKKMLEQGRFNIEFTHIKLFASIISSYFCLFFKQKELPYVDEFLKIKKYLKYRKEKDNLQLSTKYVTWTYTPRKIKTIRQNVARLRSMALDINNIKGENKSLKGTRRFLNIGYISNKVDSRQLSTSLCVHIIRTQETYVMMNWLITAQFLNKLFQNKLNLDYFSTPNNDCFGTNFKHIVFLRYHIENAYNVCHNDDIVKSLLEMFSGNTKTLLSAQKYIKTVIKEEDDPNYWDGIITNDYFIKH